MSHVIKVTDIHWDKESVREVARLNGLTFRERDSIRFYDGTVATGTTVHLRGWSKPIVVKDDNELVYDNYFGNWGRVEELNDFQARIVAHMSGYDPERVTLVERGNSVVEYIVEEH